MIILSFKTYKEATGEKAVFLSQIIKKVRFETGVEIIPAVQPTDIYRIKKEVGIEVWAQHMDPIDPGKNFGWLSPYSLKNAGATGVVINHSEHKNPDDQVKKILNKAKEYGLRNVVIGFNTEMVIKYNSWDPDYVSYEREDMIGGGISMITQEIENIKKLVKILKKPLIIGAGISTVDDIRQVLSLGAKGVILSSAFVLAKNPEEKLKELALIFKNNQ